MRYELHRGKAPDGSPYVVLLKMGSANTKTGNLSQVYILPEMLPSEAIKKGADFGVCADCPKRPFVVKRERAKWRRKMRRRKAYRDMPRGKFLRAIRETERRLFPLCYVNPRSLNALYRAWERGKYPIIPENEMREKLAGIAQTGIRLGAYGNPDLIPLPLLSLLCEIAKGEGEKPNHTGYTHNWRNCSPEYSLYLMASCDTREDANEAQAMRWKTFRVATTYSDMQEGEFRCPASVESHAIREYRAEKEGRTTSPVRCEDCLLCAGNGSARARNVIIADHGAGSEIQIASRVGNLQQYLGLIKRES